MNAAEDDVNDLFIYNGTGSKGINLGQKAIGMHESLFNSRNYSR